MMKGVSKGLNVLRSKFNEREVTRRKSINNGHEKKVMVCLERQIFQDAGVV